MISICATCYNHEKFVSAFVESVLRQTSADWERAAGICGKGSADSRCPE